MSDLLSSFEEFAGDQTRRGGTPCWTCNIPERDVVEQVYLKGRPSSLIAEWLLERCGYKEAPREDADEDEIRAANLRLQRHLAARLNRHFRKGHHDVAE